MWEKKNFSLVHHQRPIEPNMVTCQIQRWAVLIKSGEDHGIHTCSIVFEISLSLFISLIIV